MSNPDYRELEGGNVQRGNSGGSGLCNGKGKAMFYIINIGVIVVLAIFAFRPHDSGDDTHCAPLPRTCADGHCVPKIKQGLGRTPPMGWNSWYSYGCNISDAKIRATVDLMESQGYLAAGYEYIAIDDCWSVKTGRDENGTLVPDPHRFPHGMKALADYVHVKGFKLGIYSDLGNWTCAGYPGSYGHECHDAQTFADWGIDYLKEDYCHSPDNPSSKVLYSRMAKCLNETGRPMLFGLCSWGRENVWEFGGEIANMWRISADLQPNYDSVMRTIDNILNSEDGYLGQYAGPYGWNDPDVMQILDSEDETVSLFTWWVMLPAPLFMGINLQKTDNPAYVASLWKNEEAIAINQDLLGATAVFNPHDSSDRGSLVWCEVYTKDLSNGDVAVMFFHRDNWSGDQTMKIQFKHILGWTGTTNATVRDVLNQQDMGTYTGIYTDVVKVHASKLFRLTPLNLERSFS